MYEKTKTYIPFVIDTRGPRLRNLDKSDGSAYSQNLSKWLVFQKYQFYFMMFAIVNLEPR